jgi:hypothetical protein
MSSTFLHLKFPPDVPNHHLTSTIQPSFPTQILSSTSPTSHIHIHIEQQIHTVYLESTQLDATINLHNELPYTTIHYQKTTLGYLSNLAKKAQDDPIQTVKKHYVYAMVLCFAACMCTSLVRNALAWEIEKRKGKEKQTMRGRHICLPSTATG